MTITITIIIMITIVIAKVLQCNVGLKQKPAASKPAVAKFFDVQAAASNNESSSSNEISDGSDVGSFIDDGQASDTADAHREVDLQKDCDSEAKEDKSSALFDLGEENESEEGEPDNVVTESFSEDIGGSEDEVLVVGGLFQSIPPSKEEEDANRTACLSMALLLFKTLREKFVYGDGNCFFRAMSLHTVQGESGYKDLRVKVVEEVRTHWPDYAQFLPGFTPWAWAEKMKKDGVEAVY